LVSLAFLVVLLLQSQRDLRDIKLSDKSIAS